MSLSRNISFLPMWLYKVCVHNPEMNLLRNHIPVWRQALILPFRRDRWGWLICSSSSISTCIVLNWISGIICYLLTFPFWHYQSTTIELTFNQKVIWKYIQVLIGACIVMLPNAKLNVNCHWLIIKVQF